MIRAIQQLPELLMLLPRDEQRFAYINQRARWIHLGAKIDYLQKLQLGFLPPDPTPTSLHPLVQKQIHLVADYLFWMLQVVIEGFDDIKLFASRKNRNFPFADPRQLFAQICNEFSAIEMYPISSTGIGVGKTLTEVRSTQSLTGKFLRFSLSPQKEAELCSSFEASGLIYGFAIAAIYSTSRPYLKKVTNKRGQTWKQFRDAHKAMLKFCNTPPEGDAALCTMNWSVGHPVFSQSSKPVNFPSLLNLP